MGEDYRMRTLSFCLLTFLGAAVGVSPTCHYGGSERRELHPGRTSQCQHGAGSMFVLKGQRLGPASVAIATSFPLTTSLSGTSVQVSVGGQNVGAIIYYTLRRQSSCNPAFDNSGRHRNRDRDLQRTN